MSINFDKFTKWAISRFGEDNVLVKGKEVRINSIFSKDDENFHLWCSPTGGKKKRKFGVYHCFKTDQKGSLLKLVQIVDSCDRDDALDVLDGKINIRELEKKIQELLYDSPEPEKTNVVNSLNLPLGTYLISDLGTNNWWRQKAEIYLSNRKIPIEGLYICNSSELFHGIKYKNRIIIPYYDSQGKMIYWNARDMFGKSKQKYLGPPKEIGIGKEDVIFMAGAWPPPESTIYLCEGEFNAISLKLCEFNAAACGGKNMSEKQALMLANYKIVLCLDRDKAGKEGTTKMASMISSVETVKGKEKLKFVTPPQGFNDWNEMLVKLGEVFVHHYILKNQKNLDHSWPHGTYSGYINDILND
jgi:Toprim-like